MFFRSKKNPHETSCLVCHALVAVILFVIVLASMIGVVMAHYDFVDGVAVFGTNQGALSLIALSTSLAIWMHHLRSCMSNCDMCGVTGKKK